MLALKIASLIAYGATLLFDVRTTIKGLALGAREVSPVYGTKGGRVRWWLVCVIEGVVLAGVLAGFASGALWAEIAALGILGVGGVRHIMAVLNNRRVLGGLR